MTIPKTIPKPNINTKVMVNIRTLETLNHIGIYSTPPTQLLTQSKSIPTRHPKLRAYGTAVNVYSGTAPGL